MSVCALVNRLSKPNTNTTILRRRIDGGDVFRLDRRLLCS
jgi:hypothetical protein